MKLSFIMLLLSGLVAGCSNLAYQDDSPEKSILSRGVANVREDIHKMSAAEKLDELVKHIEVTAYGLPQKGNPRFYIFEHFQRRVLEIVAEIKATGSAALSEVAFVPNDKNLITKFYHLYAASKIMDEAGIYVSASQKFGVLNEDSKEASDNLFNLARFMDFYYREISERYSLVVTPEVRVGAESSERVRHMRYLVARVENHMQPFVNRRYKGRVINGMIMQIRKLDPPPVRVRFEDFDKYKKGFERYVKELRKLRNSATWRKAHAYLKDLDLPHSGGIDGADDAFEMVMSTQLSMEILDFIVDKQLRNSKI
ncbi:MAG: hypothetical protein HN509_13315 [Halobacteriovoraceae bacterium]|jgi:hypothetical protein|nr:hypothetical protein [Halobacteriovoraceae bacterium]MBT5095948.1 hypothetical protein [Halobacteriovoraceae bacterium]